MHVHRSVRYLPFALLAVPLLAIAADGVWIRSDAVYASASSGQAAVQAWLARQDDDAGPADALGAVRVRYEVAVDPAHGPDWNRLAPVPRDGTAGDTVQVDACADGTLRHWSFRHDDATWRRTGYRMQREACTPDALRDVDG